MSRLYEQFRPAPRIDPYQPKNPHANYQVYDSDYFSGADVHLYLGDIWVDEITSFQFTIQEQVFPIYGYHSYTVDHYARGKRIIQGQFSINFKSTGYLKEIIKHQDAIEYAIEEGKESLGDPRIYEKYKLDEVLKLYGKESFEQLAEEYEKAIWGEEENTANDYLTSGTQPFFQQKDTEGFDIRIQYGAISDMVQNQSFYNSKNPKPNHSVEIINGVQLINMSKSMSTASQGSPIQEVYTFMATDLNASSI